MDGDKNKMDQNQDGSERHGPERDEEGWRGRQGRAGRSLTSLFPDPDLLGQTEVRIGGVTLWYGRGVFDEPYFLVQVPVAPPTWYPFVYYRIAESYDGDGWIVRCEHNSASRALILRGHPFLSGRPLPELLAAVAALARERVNLFQELDRPWHEAREFDYARLEPALREGLTDAEFYVFILGLDGPGEDSGPGRLTPLREDL